MTVYVLYNPHSGSIFGVFSSVTKAAKFLAEGEDYTPAGFGELVEELKSGYSFKYEINLEKMELDWRVS